MAEAVLIQGTDRGSSSIAIGTSGNWNSSHAQRHYMLHSRVNIEMTDPEIRGDIDGFVLGSTISTTLGTYSSLRLSQLLDMYYSSRVRIVCNIINLTSVEKRDERIIAIIACYLQLSTKERRVSEYPCSKMNYSRYLRIKVFLKPNLRIFVKLCSSIPERCFQSGLPSMPT